MERRYLPIVLAAIMLALATMACGGGKTPEATEERPTAVPTATATAEPTETPTRPPTQTPEPTDTPEPMDTPLPTQVAPSSVSLGELEGTWEPAIGTAALVQGAYEAILKTAEDIQAGEIDSAEVSDELLAEAIVLKAVQDTLAEWNPPEDMVDYKEELEGYVAKGQEILSQWFDEEITPVEVEDFLASDYEDLAQMVQDAVRQAELDGLAMEDIEAMLDELSASIEENLDIEVTVPLP